MVASEHPDAWLWVGMVAVSYYAAYAIRAQLVRVRKAVQITKPEKLPDMVSQDTEDAIKLKTLGQLANSPNFDIREASIRILTQRALKPGPTWDLLQDHLASPRASRRNKALVTLCFIREVPGRSYPQCSDHPIWQPEFLSAFVTSLRNLLPSARAAYQKKNYPSEHQANALAILNSMLTGASHGNLQRLLDAGLITEWLAQYPFSTDWSANNGGWQRKAESVRRFVKHGEGEPCNTDLLRGILHFLLTRSVAREQLVEARLWEWKFDREDEKERTRHLEESPEEVQLRRRRREAVVIGEEGRAITREDIYQRGEDVRDEDVEDQLENLWEEEAVRRAGQDRGSIWDVVRRLRPNGLAAQ